LQTFLSFLFGFFFVGFTLIGLGRAVTTVVFEGFDVVGTDFGVDVGVGGDVGAVVIVDFGVDVAGCSLDFAVGASVLSWAVVDMMFVFNLMAVDGFSLLVVETLVFVSPLAGTVSVDFSVIGSDVIGFPVVVFSAEAVVDSTAAVVLVSVCTVVIFMDPGTMVLAVPGSSVFVAPDEIFSVDNFKRLTAGLVDS